MATIVKRERKSGTVYLADVRIHGFPRQKKTFKRLTDAKLWAQQTEASIRKGEFRNVVSTARRKTLNDVIQRYRDDILPHKSPTTQRVERTYIAFWERQLGTYALSYIEPDKISETLRELSEAGDGRRKAGGEALENGNKHLASVPKPKSRKTIKHYRDTLAMLFRYAVQWEWTGTNPMDSVSRITRLRNERVRYLSDDERKRLLDACKVSDNELLYPIVVFALSTGARKGEILGLTLDDVDLARDTAILRDTKNGDTRAVPVVHHLHDLLVEQIRKTEKFYAELDPPFSRRWLFPRRDGLQPIDIRTAWENARDTAKLEDFRFHDLRHSTASYLAMNGASLVEIADILGHRTLQMVRRYSHLSESHVKGVIKNLNEKLF